MKSLEEYNRERSFHSIEYPYPNGIECPKCGKEMSDESNAVLCSIPPKKVVICTSCGHRDYAFC